MTSTKRYTKRSVYLKKKYSMSAYRWSKRLKSAEELAVTAATVLGLVLIIYLLAAYVLSDRKPDIPFRARGFVSNTAYGARRA